VGTEHSRRGEPDKLDNQDIHNRVALDTVDMLAQDIALVASDMAEHLVVAQDIAPAASDMVEHLVVVLGSLASAQRTHCSVGQDYLFSVVVVYWFLAAVAQKASRPDETTVLLMDKQVRRWSHVRDA
jgi:hypothetical protein